METRFLSVVEVNKRFGGVLAVQDMSFELRADEALGLIGPNGAGKTTLMNIISGVDKPDTGAIKFNGHNITGFAPHKICRLGIGRTFQIPQPFINLTVLQNLVVAAEYAKGFGNAEAKKQALKILEMVGLYPHKDTLTKNLTAITLKRLELARVLATGPKLILLDEVAAGLTEEEIPPMLEILRGIRQTGVTYIMIEHVMRVIMKAVDRIVVMAKGAKIAEGPPKEIMKDKKVIEAYLGDAL